MKTINTIADLERIVYGPLLDDQIRKTQTVTTAVSGYRNAVMGARLWTQLNSAANTFGILPKKPWDKSGYRAITAASASTAPGIAESGAIPTAVIPTIVEVTAAPHVHAAAFEMNSTMVGLENVDDNVKWADLAEYMGEEFKSRLDIALNATNHTVAGNNIDSIDRHISAYAEIASQTLDAGDVDPYAPGATGAWNDRDAAAGWTDAYLGHNSNTERYLALSHIDGIFQNVRPYWKDPGSVANKVIQTGYDTELRVAQLLQSQLRYTTQRVQPSVSGLKSMSGVDGGFDVASYNGVPIIPNANTRATGTIANIILIDLDFMHIGVLKPVQYLESEDYQALGYFLRQGVYYTEMELITTKFNCHGKVIDLK